MGVLKMYLGGALIAIFGIITILVGFVVGIAAVAQNSEGVCLTGIVIIVIGFIIYAIGKFYVGVSKRTTPVIMVEGKDKSRKQSLPPPPPPSYGNTSSYSYRAGDSKEDIEEKIRKLRRLYDDGLISEEEYEEKKKELLERL